MRYHMQVTSKALPGREEEYDRWYDETHMWEVLALPGFFSCQRFIREAPGTPDDREFIAMYEVETDDPDTLLQMLFDETPNMQMTEAIDVNSVRFDFLKPRGDLHQKKHGAV